MRGQGVTQWLGGEGTRLFQRDGEVEYSCLPHTGNYGEDSQEVKRGAGRSTVKTRAGHTETSLSVSSPQRVMEALGSGSMSTGPGDSFHAYNLLAPPLFYPVFSF